MNATGEPDLDSAVRGASRPVLSPIGVAARSPRGQLAMIAIGSLVVVAAVLGWRWAHRPRVVIAVAAAAVPVAAAATPSAPSVTLEVTVLEVRSLPPPAAIAPPVVAPAVAPPPTPAPPAPANRTLIRSKKLAHPAGGRSEPVEARPVEHVEPTPPAAQKPDPQKPAIEANPYLYK
jgi:hypothetical protein